MDNPNNTYVPKLVDPVPGAELVSGEVITSGYLQVGPYSFVPHQLCVKKLHPDAKLPTKAKSGDFGYDMYALEKTVLRPGTVTKVRTGIALGFPSGFGGIICDRSGIATKPEYQVFKVAGVVDNGYTGEVIVALFNPVKLNWNIRSLPHQPWHRMHSAPVVINPGDKIAQIVLQRVWDFPVVEVDELEATERGSDGFGSTGI